MSLNPNVMEVCSHQASSYFDALSAHQWPAAWTCGLHPHNHAQILQPGSDRSFGVLGMMIGRRPSGGRMRSWMLSSWRRTCSSALATSAMLRRTLGTARTQVPSLYVHARFCSADSARVADLSNVGDVLKVHQEAMSSGLRALSCSSACTFTRTELLLGAPSSTRTCVQSFTG